jgi:formylglycine-generating enzyme required for sulfatase activity
VKRIFAAFLFAAVALQLSAAARPGKPRSRAAGMVRVPGATFEMGTDASEVPRLQKLYATATRPKTPATSSASAAPDEFLIFDF